MSLSIVLIIIAPIFAIPLFLLPDNKVRIFSFSLLIGFGIVLTLNIINSIHDSFGLSIGKGIYPAFNWFLKNNIELSNNERYHMSFIFIQIILFFLGSTISYVSFNTIYIGKNPSVPKKNNNTLNTIFKLIMYFISYLTVSYFLICIRSLTCMEDGFMSNIFNQVYYVGA